MATDADQAPLVNKEEDVELGKVTVHVEAEADKEEEEPKFKADVDIDEHMLDIPALEKKHGTSTTTGLTEKDAAVRLARDGPNCLTPPPKTPEWLKFLIILFGDGFSLLLWFGAILCYIVYGINEEDEANLYLGVVLTFVVIATAIFGYYQESKSTKVMEGFKNLMPTIATVVRDGEAKRINAAELVVGDLIQVSGGDKNPADFRVITCAGLKVDNSSLTGECEPLKRTVHKTNNKYWETSNMAFSGTNVTEGTGTGIVICTGDRTMVGNIAGSVALEKKPDPLLKAETKRFVLMISTVAITLGIVFMILSLVRGDLWVKSIVFMIGIIVANVPEGLLVTVTVSLTLTAQRMAKKQVLVKNLATVETLGSVTTICSDKTGTLTLNRMTASNIFYDCKIIGLDHSMPDEARLDKANPGASFTYFQMCAMLCSRATFIKEENGEYPDLPIPEWRAVGDASETGILKWNQSLTDVNDYRLKYPKVAEVPFNSNNKFALSVHEVPSDFVDNTRATEPPADKKPYILVMKGATERIMQRCDEVMIDGKIIPMEEHHTNKIQTGMTAFAKRGQRVLGMGMSLIYLDPDVVMNSDDEDFSKYYDKLVFLGLFALTDPPREEVPGAIAKCHRAGIGVVMVTGDHPTTAAAIARQIGILTLDTREIVAEREGKKPEEVDRSSVKARVISGDELGFLSDQELQDALRENDELVFARTLPKQKQQIVIAFQTLDKVVAVTGDGVNDSPAIKKADIGIAMGINGSEVAKEAADMILLDDNFASIVSGVEEGRLIFDNLKKSIAYTLTSNIPEITPFLALIIWQIPLPLDTVHILCIDLGSDMLPAIALAYETEESDIMKRKPRDRFKDKLVTWSLIFWSYLQIGIMQATAGFLAYFNCMSTNGIDTSKLFDQDQAWRDPDVAELANFPGINYTERMRILHQCQASFLCTIVMVQWMDLIIAKTRISSIFTHGLRTNPLLNWSLLEETLLIICVVYIPPIGKVFGLVGPEIHHFWPALPFVALELIYDESRKWWMRKYPNGALKKFCYY